MRYDFDFGLAGISVNGTKRRGRPKQNFPEFLCPRLAEYARLLRSVIAPEDWASMNRPMVNCGDDGEEAKRKMEYSAILRGTAYSVFLQDEDPLNSTSMPSRILSWQYEEGILGGTTPLTQVIERRSEYARRLARSLVATEAGISEDALRKLCSRHQATSASFPKSAD